MNHNSVFFSRKIQRTLIVFPGSDLHKKQRLQFVEVKCSNSMDINRIEASKLIGKQTKIPNGKRPRPKNRIFELPVSLQQQLNFERNGHVCLRKLVPKLELEKILDIVTAEMDQKMIEAYRHRVAVLCPNVDPAAVKTVEQAMEILTQGEEPVGFLQLFNLHRQSTPIADFLKSPFLAGTAAKLLGCKKVRLYQDCVFLKFPGFGATNWHSDLNMVPIDTNRFVTIWIPLRQLSQEDSSLLFASGSHTDFSLPYWQSNEGMDNLQSRGYDLASYNQLNIGDVTCHHGWTLHWAPEQPADRPPRFALTVSYFEDGAKVLSTKHARRKPHFEDAWSYQAWRKHLKEGQAARHELLPLIWTA